MSSATHQCVACNRKFIRRSTEEIHVYDLATRQRVHYDSFLHGATDISIPGITRNRPQCINFEFVGVDDVAISPLVDEFTTNLENVIRVYTTDIQDRLKKWFDLSTEYSDASLWGDIKDVQNDITGGFVNAICTGGALEDGDKCVAPTDLDSEIMLVDGSEPGSESGSSRGTSASKRQCSDDNDNDRSTKRAHIKWCHPVDEISMLHLSRKTPSGLFVIFYKDDIGTPWATIYEKHALTEWFNTSRQNPHTMTADNVRVILSFDDHIFRFDDALLVAYINNAVDELPLAFLHMYRAGIITPPPHNRTIATMYLAVLATLERTNANMHYTMHVLIFDPRHRFITNRGIADMVIKDILLGAGHLDWDIIKVVWNAFIGRSGPVYEFESNDPFENSNVAARVLQRILAQKFYNRPETHTVYLHMFDAFSNAIFGPPHIRVNFGDRLVDCIISFFKTLQITPTPNNNKYYRLAFHAIFSDNANESTSLNLDNVTVRTILDRLFIEVNWLRSVFARQDEEFMRGLLTEMVDAIQQRNLYRDDNHIINQILNSDSSASSRANGDSDLKEWQKILTTTTHDETMKSILRIIQNRWINVSPNVFGETVDSIITSWSGMYIDYTTGFGNHGSYFRKNHGNFPTMIKLVFGSIGTRVDLDMNLIHSILNSKQYVDTPTLLEMTFTGRCDIASTIILIKSIFEPDGVMRRTLGDSYIISEMQQQRTSDDDEESYPMMAIRIYRTDEEIAAFCKALFTPVEPRIAFDMEKILTANYIYLFEPEYQVPFIAQLYIRIKNPQTLKIITDAIFASRIDSPSPSLHLLCSDECIDHILASSIDMPTNLYLERSNNPGKKYPPIDTPPVPFKQYILGVCNDPYVQAIFRRL